MSDDPELPVVSLFKQRRFARISHQYRKEYLKGSHAVEAIANVASQRTQKRHRDTSDPRSRQLEARMAEKAVTS